MVGLSFYRPALARAAAQILLKHRCIQYDATNAQAPFSIDLAPLKANPASLRRLMDMSADIISSVDPDDVTAAGKAALDLAQFVTTRLHLPKTGARAARILPVAWLASTLVRPGGFAVINDLNEDGIHQHVTLTSWTDILEVMHLSGYGHRDMRFALASFLRAADDTTPMVQQAG